MRFSLIVATIGRTAELQRLFESLARQTCRDFEVIVVDQNPDDRVLTVMRQFEGRMAMRRITSDKGLSRARNAGLRCAEGDVITFPDDDCWYEPDTLASVVSVLQAHRECDGVIGQCLDEHGKPILPWKDRPGRVTKSLSWRRAVAYAYFLRRSATEKMGFFDETLGVGAGTPWGSGEDNDYMLRALASGAGVFYEPGVLMHHPQMFHAYDVRACEKRLRYAMGDGCLLRKYPMPLWWTAAFFGVPMARCLRASILMRIPEARFHWQTIRGRAIAYLGSTSA